jgi:hypothetical protein
MNDKRARGALKDLGVQKRDATDSTVSGGCVLIMFGKAIELDSTTMKWFKRAREGFDWKRKRRLWGRESDWLEFLVERKVGGGLDR